MPPPAHGTTRSTARYPPPCRRRHSTRSDVGATLKLVPSLSNDGVRVANNAAASPWYDSLHRTISSTVPPPTFNTEARTAGSNAEKIVPYIEPSDSPT